jgi:hypothetical protein
MQYIKECETSKLTIHDFCVALHKYATQEKGSKSFIQETSFYTKIQPE